MTAKQPTPQGISRLLRQAGFSKSAHQGRAKSSSGYRVSRELVAYEQRVTVRHRHHFWSMLGGDPGPYLAKYAETITGAGYEVTIEKYRLIVTAKED